MTAYEYITAHDSPNYTPAASVPKVYGAPRVITGITVHHWGALGQSFDAVVRYLCRKGGNTSAHEVIEAGRVAVIVNHRDAAWHAGSATGNRTTIGLELRPEATDADYATAAERIADIRTVYGDLPLIPHRHWKATSCPGRWDLARLDREARAAAATHKAAGLAPSATAPASAPTPPAAPTTEEYSDMQIISVKGSAGKYLLRESGPLVPIKSPSVLTALTTGGAKAGEPIETWAEFETFRDAVNGASS